MHEETRMRAVAVVVLVGLGAVLGVAGGALGVGGPTVGDDPGAEFVVGQDNVSVAHGGERTILRDLDVTEDVAIERVDGGYRVSTQESGPLSQAERGRAKRVAGENATVAARLNELSDYDLRVEPIRRLQSDHAITGSVDVNNSTSQETNDSAVTYEFETVERGGDSVTVNRDPTFVEEEVVVAVHRPGDEDAVFDVHVDLENETVTDVED